MDRAHPLVLGRPAVGHLAQEHRLRNRLEVDARGRRGRVPPGIEVLVDGAQHRVEAAPGDDERSLERVDDLRLLAVLAHVDHDPVDPHAAVGAPARARTLADPAHGPAQRLDPVLHLAGLTAALLLHPLGIALAIRLDDAGLPERAAVHALREVAAEQEMDARTAVGRVPAAVGEELAREGHDTDALESAQEALQRLGPAEIGPARRRAASRILERLHLVAIGTCGCQVSTSRPAAAAAPGSRGGSRAHRPRALLDEACRLMS